MIDATRSFMEIGSEAPIRYAVGGNGCDMRRV